MPSRPLYASAKIRSESAVIVAANTTRDASSTTGIVDLIAAPGPVAGLVKGCRVEVVRLKALGTTTAGVIRLWKKNGSTYRLFKEVSVAAKTATGGVQAWEDDQSVRSQPGENIPAVILKESEVLCVSSYNLDAGFVATAEGGDF